MDKQDQAPDDHRPQEGAELRVVQMENRYFGLLEAAPDAMVIVDEHGTIVLLNLQAEKRFGYRRDELLSKTITTIIPSGFAERLIADDRRTAAEALAQQIGSGLELTGRRKNGTTFPIEIMLSPMETSTGLLVTAAIRDISLRKIAESKIIYLNRIYATLSGINALIIRAREQGELFREACRIAVRVGEFGMAWIGLVNPEGTKIDLVASAGVDAGLAVLLNERYLLDETAWQSRSLVVRAITEKKPMISNSSQTDSLSVFGKEYSVSEVNSFAVLPLVIGDETAGIFALYSKESEFFDEVEMDLLIEMAGDISFAMASISKQDQLSYLAYYDLVTGLANQKLFLERVAQYLRIARQDGHKLALYLIDLDGFKNINDSLGQNAGDSLLKQVAEWLTDRVGDINLLARVGSNHYAAVMPKLRHESDAAHLIKTSMAVFMEHLFRLNDADFQITVKLGVAVFPDDAATAEEMFRKAESALKKAKLGGVPYLFYTEAMTELVSSRLLLENKLRKAITNKEFVLYYQPKFNLASGQLTGAEALIRWNDPEGSQVSPSEFIPILEDTGMIHEVGRWVLRTASADYLRWRALGLAVVRIAVNVSQLQLRDEEFISEVQKIVDTEEGAAEGLELEITEGLMMNDVLHNLDILDAIRAMGIVVAIDDFGTGYSSLSHLTRLPLDTLKIDVSFVKEMAISEQGRILVHAIISLAHLLDLNVVAEGVETEEQSAQLKLLNCNEVQGYLFSKPLPSHIFQSRFLIANSQS